MSRFSLFLRVQSRQLLGARWYWSKAKHYKPEWDQRAERAAAMCADARWVCDLGCGPQFLRRHLGQGVVYLPADLKRWTPDTELCDLNAGELPTQSLTLCDTCVMMGVIGRVRDPLRLFGEFAQHVEHLVFSYFDEGQNSLSLDELIRSLQASGFKIVTIENYSVWKMVKAANERFDDQARLARLVARERWRRMEKSN